MADTFDYVVGDVIELLTDKESYTYSAVNEADREVWKKGTHLVISKIYYDGDVYAKNDKNVSRMIRKDEFTVIRPDLSAITIGNVTIHSNVSSELIENHYKRIKEDAEKKRKEEEELREEYLKKYGTRYPSYYQLHPDEKPKSPYNESMYPLIKFYEWSDLNSIPRQFTSLTYFLQFLDNNYIHYTFEDKNYLSNMTYAYCTCIRGKAELLIAATINGLESMLERFSKNEEEVEEKSSANDGFDWILCKDTNRYTYLKTITYTESGDVSSFTFGDVRDEAHKFDKKDEALKASAGIKNKTAGFIDLIPVALLKDI